MENSNREFAANQIGRGWSVRSSPKFDGQHGFDQASHLLPRRGHWLRICKVQSAQRCMCCMTIPFSSSPEGAVQRFATFEICISAVLPRTWLYRLRTHRLKVESKSELSRLDISAFLSRKRAFDCVKRAFVCSARAFPRLICAFARAKRAFLSHKRALLNTTLRTYRDKSLSLFEFIRPMMPQTRDTKLKRPTIISPIAII